MTDKFTTQAIEQVAQLARLRLSAEELESFRPQLASIIQYIDRIGELDVEGVEPMAHPLPLTNHLADDVVEPSLDVAKLLKNAPAVEDNYFSVPKVIGKGDE